MAVQSELLQETIASHQENLLEVRDFLSSEFSTLQSSLKNISDDALRSLKLKEGIHQSLLETAEIWKQRASDNFKIMTQQGNFADSHFWGQQYQRSLLMIEELNTAALNGLSDFNTTKFLSNMATGFSNSFALVDIGFNATNTWAAAEKSINTGDFDSLGKNAFDIGLASVFGIFSIGAIGLFTTSGVAVFGAGAVAGIAAYYAGNYIWEDLGLGEWYGESVVPWAESIGEWYGESVVPWAESIGEDINNFFNDALRAVIRRDPLTLDLDGDGLETVGIDLANPILFDHDGDGNKAATGWIKPDDGFLVLDRNGNGTIDDGTELFGDSTPLNDGSGNAEDGFAALAQEDTNADGVVDANDANFADLRVWQDYNSDGISQADELKTLDEAGVVAINVAKTENSQPLANGNLLADIGSYVRNDGTSSDVGSVSAELGDIDLAENTFISQFTDSIPLTPEAEALPDMNGSGQVRNLREAVSLSPTLAALLTQYDAATTRSEQLALLDELLTEWSQTSELAVTGDGAYDGLTTNISISGLTEGTAGYDEWINQLQILERFNGRNFVTPSDGAAEVNLNFFAARRNFIDQSYSALRQTVYDGLLLQTRLEPYVNSMKLVLTDTNASVDFGDTNLIFESHFENTPGEAVRDLLDLQRIAGTNISRMGWDGLSQLRDWLASTTVDGVDPTLQPELVSALNDFGYSGFRINGDGTNASEVIIGNDTGSVLNGSGGNDLLLGSTGDDTLNGGTGNDTLYGGDGNDTYQLNLGDGHDTIIETHGDSGIDTGTDTITFGDGIITGDISILREGDNLRFAHSNGQDSIVVNNWFNSLNDDAHRLDTITFADGQSFDLGSLKLGTTGDDVLLGTVNNDILSGDTGSDTLVGYEGNDWLDGGTGDDTLVGGTGDDLYVVDSALDVVIEEADEGIDTVDSRISYTLTDNVENLRLAGSGSTDGSGNTLDNTITGNAGNNTLSGLAGNDTLNGGAGNDTLDGGSGIDTMSGGTGNDTYIVDTLDDVVTENIDEGTDTVQTQLDYTLGDNVENLELTGSASVTGTGNTLNNTITGNNADNTLEGLAGNDRLDGGTGADTLLGGSGNDTYVVDNSGDAVIENINEGSDTVESSIIYTLTDNVENLTLSGATAIDGSGNELDNTIKGNTANNTLTGLAGNDRLDGGAGVDTMLGGTGNDTYVVDNSSDVVIENLTEGNDTVESNISYTLGDNLENLNLTGSSNIDGTGNELDNTLTGNSRNNTLDGGTGADAMAGAGGNDTYIIDNAGDTVTENYGQGTDTIVSPFDYTLDNNVENLTLTGEAITGTGNSLNNVITGTAADNTLTGLAGNDTLIGGEGVDTMVGGTGNDTYVVDNVLDQTIEQTGEGIDTVKSNLTWTLNTNLDNLTLTGSADIDGTGNVLNNVIIGNSGSNTLTGLEGNDTLDGGAGADTMLGGTGNDTYIVDNSGDAVIENVNAGSDIVESSITYTLTDNVENLTLTGLAAIDGTGNELDNFIKGNNANNILTGLEGHDTLDGAGGADTLVGGSGNDTYIVENSGDVVVENLNEGIDTVNSSVSHSLNDNVENLILTGSSSINATGNTLDNVITGNSGNNTLDGGAGSDAMAGGTGDDTYLVDNINDTVTELAGQGNDTIISSVDYTLAENVENLILSGTDNINGTGNTLDNTIIGNDVNNSLNGLEGNDTLTGNAGNDRLDGGAGADTMTGGLGDDTYVVDNVDDSVTELLDEGVDTVESSISYALNDNVENLILTGNTNIDATGNELDNTIVGNTANNVLDGGLGADTMSGGTGDDTYIIDANTDIVIEILAEGNDSVISDVSYTLTDNVENLALTGEANLDGSGNDLDNLITGNTGNNVLDGGTGIDTLTGGAGNDTYIIDNSNDVINELANEGSDTAISDVNYVLSDNVENLTLTGSADIDGTGNSANNVLTSNDGVNTLSGLAGNDTYNVNSTYDVIVENIAEGNDTVNSSSTYTLSDNIENLNLTGTENIDGTGNDLNNTITGNSGSNVIDGGAGCRCHEWRSRGRYLYC